MFNQKDLYAALQSGANPEAIAQQFADALNGAIAQRQKEEADAAKAKAEAEARRIARIDAIGDIIDEIADFVEEFYPDMYDAEMWDAVDPSEIDKIIYDSYKEVIAMVGPLKEMINAQKKATVASPAAKPVIKTATTVTPQDADADLRAFLTRNGC